MPEYPAQPPSSHPYLIMNPKSGGGKVERFDLKRKAEDLGAEVFVACLNRPGGNISGVSYLNVTLAAKLLGLSHDLVPGAARIGVLFDPSDSAISERFVSDLRTAASAIRQPLELLHASNGHDIDAVFASLAQKPVDALVVSAGTLFYGRRVQLVTLAAFHRAPAIYPWREAVEIGGLMSYGTSLADAVWSFVRG
jgi:putative ABC transport system substrate-binding protein